ncbi:MAG: hypothetical protein JRC87_10475 [Deltaproteobacteria bacterium]|nr:hypothetical protein [Deltaproteobacteria bacterium]
MTEKSKYTAAYLTWRSAWRLRCCPPDDLLYGEETRELIEHLKYCPWCREERATGNNFEFPAFRETSAGKGKASPEPGELWSLKQSLGNWGPKERYYSPPLVVVVEVTGASVTVYQSYGDMDLAGSDDLPFQTDLIGFSQPWNRYCLKIGDLDICYGQVYHDPDKELLPTGNGNEQSADTGSLFWFFRQMEVETGYFFARQALPSLMAGYEEVHTETPVDIFSSFHDDSGKMINQLLNLGFVLPEHPLSQFSAIDLLFNVQPPDDLFPLAAADRAASTDYALNFTMRNGEIVGVEAAAMEITAWRWDGPLLHITGTLTETVSENLKIFFRLQMKNIHFEPLPGNFGIEEGFFWALFHVEDADMEEGECIVRIITDEK